MMVLELKGIFFMVIWNYIGKGAERQEFLLLLYDSVYRKIRFFMVLEKFWEIRFLSIETIFFI